MSRRSTVVAGIGIAALILAIVVLKFIANRGTGASQVRYQSIPEGRSDTLIVLVRGIGPRGSIEEIRQLAATTFPSAHLLAPTYNSNPFSNANPTVMAAEIETTITELHRRNGYKRIILVGYSAGAVLMRKVYLWGAGVDEDRPVDVRLSRARPWVGSVERIVLLAGMNRGWSADDIDAFGSRLTVKAALWLARISGTGRLMRSMERGSPFIGNMRVQWIDLARGMASSHVAKLPMVIQLLGTKDAVVSRSDSRDIAASTGFVFIPVGGGTDHIEILKFNAHSTDPTARFAGDVRRQAVLTALSGSPEQVEKAAMPLSPEERHEDSSVLRYVFIKHGIRDFGDWTQRFADEVRKRPDRAVLVEARHYDYFPMGAFLLLNARQSHVRELADAYTEARAKYPKAKFEYFGHSNGTYLLASALERYPAIKFHRVVFAGSVAPIGYDWRSKRRNLQVEDVVNIVGSADWVVGIFPHLFEVLAPILGRPARGMFDIGAAGFRGFSQVDDVENIYYASGTHGAGFGNSLENIPAIVDYLTRDEIRTVRLTNKVDASSPWVSFLSKFCIVVWILIIGVLFALGRMVAKLKWRGLVRTRASWLCYLVLLFLVLTYA